MNMRAFWVFIVAPVLVAIPALAQTASGGRGGRGGPGSTPPAANRGGAPAAAASGAASSSGRADPRQLLEAVEARFQSIDEQELKEPPNRDLQIEAGGPQKTKLYRADPKLFENKFVARLTVIPPTDTVAASRRAFDPRFMPTSPKEQRQLDLLDKTGDAYDDHHRSPSFIMKLLADRCPAEQAPEPLIKYLTSPDCDRDVQAEIREGGRIGIPWTYLVYAPTVEEAEARSKAILRLFDCGLCRPMQQHFLDEGKKILSEARATCEQHTKLVDEVRGEEEKIAKPSEVSGEILNQLKAQRVMVAVELAGLNARVKACDSMLNEPKRLEVSTLQSVSDMKVKAEIERIGIKEKLDQINAFIADGDRREAVQQTIAEIRNKQASVQRTAAGQIGRAETDAMLVEYYKPREVQENKIVISPVEWTE